MSKSDEIWKCKCCCVSKQSHRGRWAFISTYKHNNFSKYKKINCDQDDLNSESRLVDKFRIKRNIENHEKLIPVKKVKFDEITNKIILEIDEEKQPKKTKSKQYKQLKKISNSEQVQQIIIQKDLIDLRELFGYNKNT